MKCFKALCGQIKVTSLLDLIPGLNESDAEFVDQKCDWTSAAHWAAWWMRSAHLQMLHMDFSTMTSDVWNKCPNNTNAVERRNQDCKNGSSLPVRQCLVSVYKLDKAFCAKFLAAKLRIGTIYLTKVELLSQKQQRPRPERHKGKGQHYIRIPSHNLGHRIRHNIFMIQERGIYNIIAISSIASV